MVTATAKDFIEQLPRLIYFMDYPEAGPGLFPQFMVSKLAKQHVKVVLGGQGGDEIFGGYTRYLIAYLEQALKGAIMETQEEGKFLVGLDTIIPNLPVLRHYTPLLKHFWSEGLFEPMDERYFRLVNRSDKTLPLLADDFLKQHLQCVEGQVKGEFKKIFNFPNNRSYINKMTFFDLQTLLPALLHVEDRVSMAVSLESRVPLLDYRIFDLMARVPPFLKFPGGATKQLLRNIAEPHLPPAVMGRKDKMGFPVPLGPWTKGPLREFLHDTLLSPTALGRGIYRADGVLNMLNNPAPYDRALWGLLSMEIWFKTFIDQKRPSTVV